MIGTLGSTFSQKTRKKVHLLPKSTQKSPLSPKKACSKVHFLPKSPPPPPSRPGYQHSLVFHFPALAPVLLVCHSVSFSHMYSDLKAPSSQSLVTMSHYVLSFLCAMTISNTIKCICATGQNFWAKAPGPEMPFDHPMKAWPACNKDKIFFHRQKDAANYGYDIENWIILNEKNLWLYQKKKAHGHLWIIPDTDIIFSWRNKAYT